MWDYWKTVSEFTTQLYSAFQVLIFPQINYGYDCHQVKKGKQSQKTSTGINMLC